MVMAGSMYVPPSMLGLDFSPGSRSAGDTVPDVMRTRSASGRGRSRAAGRAARPSRTRSCRRSTTSA